MTTKYDFKYVDATDTKKPGYLARKWDRMFPGWRRAKKAPEPQPDQVVQLRASAKR